VGFNQNHCGGLNAIRSVAAAIWFYNVFDPDRAWWLAGLLAGSLISSIFQTGSSALLQRCGARPVRIDHPTGAPCWVLPRRSACSATISLVAASPKGCATGHPVAFMISRIMLNPNLLIFSFAWVCRLLWYVLLSVWQQVS
jgi:hypothetical protein